MPRGPKGEKRPGDVIGAAIRVAQIATGEAEEKLPEPKSESARRGGLTGGKARAEKLSPEQRKQIAAKAAAARWTRR
jgi:hypothetical protein